MKNMNTELNWLFCNLIVEESVEYNLDSEYDGIGVKVKWYDSVSKDYVEIIDIDGIDKLTMKQIRHDMIKLLKFIRERLEFKYSITLKQENDEK